MNMQRKKYRSSQKNTKRQLTTTATAVIALNAGVALAVPCPTTIDSPIPGACTLLDGHSVTVTNVGSVDGINVLSTTTGTFITVDTGGEIFGSTAGIKLSSAALTGSISNSGAITTPTSGSAIGISLNTSTVTGSISNSREIHAVTGIKLDTSSVVAGGISNSGTITFYDNGKGINIDHSTVGILGNSNDIINNSGTIVRTGTGNSAGIIVQTTSTIYGNINNASTGLISGAKTGIMVAGTSTIHGGISNAGAISATGTGIKIASTSAIKGGISNSGTITNGADSVNGILVNHGTIGTIDNNNGIVNSGTIRTRTNGYGRDGINVQNGSTIYGGISNTTTGSISHAATGIEVNNSTVNGGISNAGTISAGSAGMAIRNNSIINGGISNSGAITVETTGGIKVFTATVTGGISNSGSITAEQSGIIIGNNALITGGIFNSNFIQVTAATSAGGIASFSGSNISGGITNSGTIAAGTHGPAIIINASQVSDGIANTGTLNGRTGIHINATAQVTSGGITNNGFIQATNKGIGLSNNSAVTGSISNAGTIDASATGIYVSTNSVVHGNISNSGTIGVSGAGNDHGIYVDNTAQIYGDIFNSGTIDASGDGDDHGIHVANSTVSGDVVNSGIISASGDGNDHGIHVSNTATIIGSISNNGTINAGKTGIYVGTNSSINGGISNSGTIQSSTKAIFVNGGVIPYINIHGQTARIIGEVDAINTPVNITSDAVFTNEGAFNVQNFNIATDALFYMAHPITVSMGTGLVDNFGTLSIATGTQQTITGNYTQEANGTFQIGATNRANYGQLIAHDVDLSASGAINVQLQSGSIFHQGDVLTNVLQSDNASLTGPSSFTITDNSFFWQFTGSINANNGVDLTIGVNPAVSSACSGSYCEGATTVITEQVAVGNSDFSLYGTLLTTDAFATAASQATPELINENLQAIQLVTRTVLDVLPMPSPIGKSAGDAMLYQPGKVWLKPYGASMKQNQRNTVNGYTASVYGLIGGGDIQIADNWLLGGALAAGGDHIRGQSVLDGQSIDSSQYQGLIYMSKLFPNHTYLAAQALLGYGDNDSQRIIPLYSSTAKGHFNSWFTNLSTELGWNRALNDRFIVTPAVSASYLYINQNAFTETGSLMDLRVQSNNNSTLVVGADANIAYHAATLNNQQDLTFTGHAGIAYDLLNSQPSTIATFVAGGPSFSTYGIQYNNAVFRGGVGLTLANPTKPFSMNLNYDLQTGNNGYSGLYTATLKYKA